MTSPQLTLAINGDSLERECYGRFLASDFPAYEDYWLRYVVPITNRPHDISTRCDAELAKIGKDAHDVCHSQLHYTILTHLAHCHAIRDEAARDHFLFTIYMVRLSSAMDPADELLERSCKRDSYGPWSEDDGKKARTQWRKKYRREAAKDVRDVTDVRDYRNKLLHGRLNPRVELTDFNGSLLAILGVKVSKQNDYVDWRKLTSVRAETNPDFEPLGDIMDGAWRVVLGYLESNWRQHLL